MLHASFINHPAYDRENLPHFLGADIYLRVFSGQDLAGIFIAELLRSAGQPVAHLVVGMVLPGRRSGGSLMPLAMGLVLDLAVQAFGSDEFFVALRSANPRVVAKLWACPWVRFYPRPDWNQFDPRVQALAPHFCGQVFGADRCDLEGRLFYDIYPTPPWGGRVPWHHDEKVNEFCRRHLRDHGRDAFLFLGPTLPPLRGLTRGRVAWPQGRRRRPPGRQEDRRRFRR